MKADKSEKERQELYDKILKVEQKEDEFLDLKKILKIQLKHSLRIFRD